MGHTINPQYSMGKVWGTIVFVNVIAPEQFSIQKQSMLVSDIITAPPNVINNRHALTINL